MRYFAARMDTSAAVPQVSFETHPSRYRHWTLAVEGEIARLTMKVQPFGGQDTEVELKSNSYDLSVDIELADAVQRLRFTHPAVKAVVVTSGHDRIFCAGANIYMLASSSHPFKVNFCKYTNETRLTIEEASAESGIRLLSRAERQPEQVDEGGGRHQVRRAAHSLVEEPSHEDGQHGPAGDRHAGAQHQQYRHDAHVGVAGGLPEQRESPAEEEKAEEHQSRGRVTAGHL